MFDPMGHLLLPLIPPTSSFHQDSSHSRCVNQYRLHHSKAAQTLSIIFKRVHHQASATFHSVLPDTHSLALINIMEKGKKKYIVEISTYSDDTDTVADTV